MIKIEAVDVTPKEAMKLSAIYAILAEINMTPSVASAIGDVLDDTSMWTAAVDPDNVTLTQVTNAAGIDIVKDDNPVSTTLVTHDKKGMPWDERIHSSSKAFNADGSWRYRKNTDRAYITEIESELRGVVPLPEGQAGLTPAPASVPPPPPVAAPVDATMTFVNFVNKITAAQAAKTLHIADVNVQVLKAGLKSLPELATRTELIPDIEKALGI